AAERPEPRLSPAARQLAADAGVDVTRIQGTGRDGLILKEDVQAQVGKREAPAPPQAAPGETRRRMSAVRQRIAERLLAAQRSAAILTTFNEADLSNVLALRARFKEAFQRKHGIGLGFMSFFVKASVEALRAFPEANARIDGGDVVYPNAYHVGVAVSTER